MICMVIESRFIYCFNEISYEMFYSIIQLMDAINTKSHKFKFYYRKAMLLLCFINAPLVNDDIQQNR